MNLGSTLIQWELPLRDDHNDPPLQLFENTHPWHVEPENGEGKNLWQQTRGRTTVNQHTANTALLTLDSYGRKPQAQVGVQPPPKSAARLTNSIQIQTSIHY